LASAKSAALALAKALKKLGFLAASLEKKSFSSSPLFFTFTKVKSDKSLS
jgi:hypothetical protein